MPHVEAAAIIHAPQARVAQLYRDFLHWPELFPATIRGVHVVRLEPDRTVLQIDHREGSVPNVLHEVSRERIDLWESKRRYDANFVNRFEPVPEGTRYTVSADVVLKGPARILAPFLDGYIRHQIQRYVLEPMRRAAEGAGTSSTGAA